MTINKSEVIQLPKWRVIMFLPMVIAGITSYGMYRANSAKQEERLDNTIIKVKDLDDSKVARPEIKILQDQLNRIEGKLDKHIDNSTK